MRKKREEKKKRRNKRASTHQPHSLKITFRAVLPSASFTWAVPPSPALTSGRRSRGTATSLPGGTSTFSPGLSLRHGPPGRSRASPCPLSRLPLAAASPRCSATGAGGGGPPAPRPGTCPEPPPLRALLSMLGMNPTPRVASPLFLFFLLYFYFYF